MKTNLSRISMFFAAALLSLVLISCGGSDTYSPTIGGQSAPPVVTVTILPPSPSIAPLGTQQFTAVVTGTSNKAVTWSIQANGTFFTAATISSTGLVKTTLTGFNSILKAVRRSGLSRPPGEAEDGSFTVTATSVAQPSASATATLTIAGSSAIVVTVSPQSPSVDYGSTKQFTATVTGNSNTAVTWRAENGTITQNGLFTAPDDGSNGNQAIVIATSVEDGAKSGQSTVNLNDG